MTKLFNTHRSLFSGETYDRLKSPGAAPAARPASSEEPASPRTSRPQSQSRKSAAGSGREAARNRRGEHIEAPPPKEHLDNNLAFMNALLNHVSKRKKALQDIVRTIEDLEEIRAREGFPSWLQEEETNQDNLDRVGGSIMDFAPVEVTPRRQSVKQKTKGMEELLDEIVNEADAGAAGQDDVMVVRFVNRAGERVPSPQRSRKRLQWRPWTPYPRKELSDVFNKSAQQADKASWTAFGDDKPVTQAADASSAKSAEPSLPFDFLGVDGWDKGIKGASKVAAALA